MNRITRDNSWTFATGLSLALMLFGSVVLAQPGPFGKGMRGEGDRLVEFLELDESQQEQWRALHETHRDDSRAMFEQVRENGLALRELLEAGGADAAEVGQIVLDGHALKTQLQFAREELQEELASILTPDQLEKFEAFQAASSQRGPRGRGRGGRGGRGGKRGAGQV